MSSDMDIDLDEYKTHYEKVREICAFYDSQARQLVDNYSEIYPEHDISGHVAFTLNGISSFLLTWHSNKERINMTPQLCEHIILMYMKITPIDWYFLENLESELIRMSAH